MTWLIRKAIYSCIRNFNTVTAARVKLIDNNQVTIYFCHTHTLSARAFPQKMAEKTLPQIFQFVDQNVQSYKNLLKEAVAIPSVSCDQTYRPECVRMVEWTRDKLKEVGATTELRDVGFQTIDGKEIKLPPVLVGVLGNDSKKNTICIYGHLDVQPALKSDGWDSDPFELVERDGKLYGRGSTDDKGPVLGWLHAINAYKGIGKELPVNLKFVFECMEESGSEGLDTLLMEHLKPEGFFDNVDFVCISDNYWLGTTKPCITYGLRGISYYFLEVECAKMDLHSGVYGGTVHEAMSDLIYLMSQLVDKDGKILITDIYKSVAPLTESEKQLYTSIDFDPEAYRTSIAAPKLAHNGVKEQLLMHRWRYPSLSLHGIEGAAFQPGAKTVIPGKVIGKFSIRIVPNQEPEEIEKLVFDYINKKWAERGSPNKMRITAQSGRAWTENPDHPHYQAAARATKLIYQTDPDMSREGGSIPVTITLQEASGRNVLLLPMGAGDDMAHSQNEKINVRNYIEGIKLFAAYLYEVGKLSKKIHTTMIKILGIVLFAATAVNSQCFYKDDSSKKLNPEARTSLYRGQLEFTLNLFNAINKAVPNDNIFFSPFSVYHTLLLAYFAAGGETEQALRKSLEIDEALDKINLMTAYKVDKRSRLTNNNSDSYEFNNANKMFIDNELQVRECLFDLFGEELEKLNFRENPEGARESINNWVARATKNNIKELIPIDGVSQSSKLVLANAAYFKGVWASKFPTERTRKEPFFVSETHQTLFPFMKQKGTFPYMVNDELGAQILELPYKGNDISMFILLPPYSMKEGVTNIIANLTPERLASVVEESHMVREVIVEIPKFTIERTVQLRQVLEVLGAGDLFSENADFTTLTDNRGIQFDDAVHKAKIQLDEEGTVAAAATAIFGFRSSRPAEPTRFQANFPFVYFLYERPTNSVLFMGVYRDPKK
ncbi:hypothetical protein K1T71_003251 [Dendrolimus kikuchii]|uniref:Uncharacterized protein n=1 Tax=Dendrolimus kikuchii TaxID=765133 RepID=A0ACC1DBA0_9NEOP|nr:hypothetical protein K1T71_003251 [Dendrolimus kikuchii]